MSDTLVDQEWMLEILYKANKTDIETYRVYKTYSRYISDLRNFVGITENVDESVIRFKPQTDLADDCLFSVTFFTEHLQTRFERYGAPSIEFYESAGKQAFINTGFPMISQNWNFWKNYVNQHFKCINTSSE